MFIAFTFMLPIECWDEYVEAYYADSHWLEYRFDGTQYYLVQASRYDDQFVEVVPCPGPLAA